MVPPGHPLAGEAMEIPGYGLDFLRDVLKDGVREGLLCTARKNAKSAIIACFVLALLAGPLATSRTPDRDVLGEQREGG